MQKKVKIMFNSIQNAREITCMHQRANTKSNSMQDAMVATCIKSLSYIVTYIVPCFKSRSKFCDDAAPINLCNRWRSLPTTRATEPLPPM